MFSLFKFPIVLLQRSWMLLLKTSPKVLLFPQTAGEDIKTPQLEEAGFQHFKVNHRYNFDDANTGAHTQNIGRHWGSAKWRNKCHRGTERHHLDSYLSEFMWRRKIPFGVEPLDAILQAIAAFMPPE